MMRNVVLLHGKPSEEKFNDPNELNPSDSNWLPWAARQFALNGYQVAKPDLPRPYAPVYEDWAREFRRHDLNDKTILVGLSAGAGFLAKWLSNHQGVTINKLALVAPWTDPHRKYGHFFATELDPRLPERCLGGLSVFYSSEDDPEAQASLEVIRTAFGDTAHYIDLPQYGHFMLGNTMTGPEFPELIDEVL